MTILLRDHWETARLAQSAKELQLREKEMIWLEKERKARDADDRAEAVRKEEAALITLLAEPAEIAELRAEVDRYDALTTEALLANEEQLAEVSDDMRVLLDRAYVLPGGRRVFKTEDGSHIFDEHGKEVTGFDPDTIEDVRPKWESFAPLRERNIELSAERADLLAYQDRLDDTRDRQDKRDLTKDELDNLQKGLEAEMPDVIRRKSREPDVEVQVVARGPGLGRGRPRVWICRGFKSLASELSTNLPLAVRDR